MLILAVWLCMLGSLTQSLSAQAGNPWRLLFSKGYRAELLVGSCVAFFSQINGALAMTSSSALLRHEQAERLLINIPCFAGACWRARQHAATLCCSCE